MQDASGQCGCEDAICSHTITSTLAAVHTRPCLFISAWQRILMLIDFPKASPHAETWTLCSYLHASAGSLLLKLRASSPNWCGGFHVSRRRDSATVNNRLWGEQRSKALSVLHVQRSMWLDCAFSHEALVYVSKRKMKERIDSTAAELLQREKRCCDQQRERWWWLTLHDYHRRPDVENEKTH